MSTPVSAALQLTEEEISRYARHLITPEVGLAGQLKLKAARVLQIGTGGLGSPITIYLAAAGVGKLGLVDSDVVEVSNLQRQVLHRTSDVGRLKLDSARDTLLDINPHVQIETYNARFSRENAFDIAQDYDIIVDGTDNLPSRYLLSDICVLLGKPWVHASVFRFEGHITVFDARLGPCYRCVHREPPPPELVQKVSVGGILGVQPGIAGCLQALEVIKLIVGKGKPLIGRLLIFDGVNMKFREVQIRKDPDCLACGPHATLSRDLMDYEAFCGVTRAPSAPADPAITAEGLKGLLASPQPPIVVDLREPDQFHAGHIPGARSIPLGELHHHLHEFTWGDQIISYCQSEERSRKATDIFRRFNFRRSRFLEGGFPAWHEHGDLRARL